MAWQGWFEYGGQEIVNVSRTEAYARAAGAGWFRPLYDSPDLPLILDRQERYNSPLQDDAPWTDDDNPDSFDFFGLYPLDVTGIENSTASAVVTESVGDGGTLSLMRRKTRTIVFNALLVGASEAAVEYGMRWLKTSLGHNDTDCTDSSTCGGHYLCYFAAEPCIDWENCDGNYQACGDRLRRNMRKTACIDGPSIMAKRTTTDGGAVWNVTFSVSAANPFEYGEDVRLIDGFMKPPVVSGPFGPNPTRDNPYVGNVTPDGGDYDDEGFVHTDVDCGHSTFTPVFDPLCPQVIPPPGPPSIDVACNSFPVNYLRRRFTIPEQYIGLWTAMVPVIQIHAKKEVRSMRLRFFADPRRNNNIHIDDPCNFCGDLMFTYIPQGSILTFDGSDHTIYVQESGGPKRRCDSLVFGSHDKPFEWPELSCGIPYIVTVDLPQTQSPPVLDLTLVPRSA